MPAEGVTIFLGGAPEMCRNSQLQKFIGSLAGRDNVKTIAVGTIPLVPRLETHPGSLLAVTILDESLKSGPLFVFGQVPTGRASLSGSLKSIETAIFFAIRFVPLVTLAVPGLEVQVFRHPQFRTYNNGSILPFVTGIRKGPRLRQCPQRICKKRKGEYSACKNGFHCVKSFRIKKIQKCFFGVFFNKK